MTTPRKQRHTPEWIVRKLRDVEAMWRASAEGTEVLSSYAVASLTWRVRSSARSATAKQRPL
jgi:hypothetical protein